MRKSSHVEVRKLAQGHTAGKQCSWDVNPGNLAPEFTLLATSLHCPEQLSRLTKNLDSVWPATLQMVILTQPVSLGFPQSILIQPGFPSNVCFSVNIPMGFQVIYKPLTYTVSLHLTFVWSNPLF